MGETTGDETRSGVWRWASVASAVILVVLLVALPGWSEIVAVVTRARLEWYGLAVAVFLGNYVPATLRWQTLQRSVGYGPSLLSSFEIVTISQGLNKILPANAGDITKTKVTERYYDVDSHAELFSLVVVERLADLVVVVVLLLVATVALATQFLSVALYTVSIGLLLGVCLAGLFLLRGPLDRLLRLAPNRFEEHLSIGLRTVRGLSGIMIGTLAVYTLVRWVLVSWSVVLIGHALARPVGFPVAVALVSGMSVVAVLPLTPGGIGPGETLGIGILLVFNVAYPVAVAIVLLQRSLGILLSALLGTGIYVIRTVGHQP